MSDERNERGRELQVVGRAQSSHNIVIYIPLVVTLQINQLVVNTLALIYHTANHLTKRRITVGLETTGILNPTLKSRQVISMQDWIRRRMMAVHKTRSTQT